MHRILQNFVDDTVETFMLVKACLTSFWFWLPVIYGFYTIFQIWMFVVIHPLTIFIVPTALAIYAIRQEKRGLRARFGIDDNKPSKIMHPFSLVPQEKQPREGFKWNVEKSMEDYLSMTKKDEEESRKEE